MDVGYLAVFLLVMGLLVGVGYHLYSTTRVSVSEIQWPDPFSMGKTTTEKKLQAAVGDLSGPLPTATAVPAAEAPVVAQVAAAAKPAATPVPPSSIPLAALERAIMAPNDASPASRAQVSAPAVVAGAQATPTAAAAAQGRMKIANTSGDGVYIRRTPRLADRIAAWPDNTVVESTGETAEGDGTKWHKVRDPRGNVGWIPSQYLVMDGAPAAAQPPANVGAPVPAAPIAGPGRPAVPAPQPAPATTRP